MESTAAEKVKSLIYSGKPFAVRDIRAITGYTYRGAAYLLKAIVASDRIRSKVKTSSPRKNGEAGRPARYFQYRG